MSDYGRLWVLGLAVASALSGCDDGGGERAATRAPEPAPTEETAQPRAQDETEPPVTNLPEVPDLMADRASGELGDRRPLALLNEAFVSEPPPTPEGFSRYEHARSCEEVADDLLLEAFTLDRPSELEPAPCGGQQRHSYVVFRRGEEAARERRLVVGAANGNPPPPMIDAVMGRVARQLGASLEPHDAEPTIVHGSELNTRDYTLMIPDDSPTMPGAWAARAVVVPKPWVRDGAGTVRMGGPIPGLLLIVFEPVNDSDSDGDINEVLALMAPMLQTVVESVRFER